MHVILIKFSNITDKVYSFLFSNFLFFFFLLHIIFLLEKENASIFFFFVSSFVHLLSPKKKNSIDIKEN